MKNNLFIAAERVTGPDEFERSLKIAAKRDLGIEIQEFYLTELRQGDWKSRLNHHLRRECSHQQAPMPAGCMASGNGG